MKINENPNINFMVVTYGTILYCRLNIDIFDSLADSQWKRDNNSYIHKAHYMDQMLYHTHYTRDCNTNVNGKKVYQSNA